MAETVIRSVIKFKRGLAADWTSKNPVLAEAEPGFELDTGKLKIGDGTTTWNNLSYLNGTFTLDLDTDCLIFNNDDELTLKGYANASVGTYLKKGVNGIEWGNPGGGGSGNLNYIDEGYFAFDRAENIYDPDDTEQEGEPIGITFYYNVFHDNNESFSDNDLVTLNYFDDLLYISENEGSAPEYTPLLIPFLASWVQNAYGLYIIDDASNLKLSISIYYEDPSFEADIWFDGATQIFKQEDNYTVDDMDIDFVEISNFQGEDTFYLLIKYEGFFQAGNRIGALTMKNIADSILQRKYAEARGDSDYQLDDVISDILYTQFFLYGPQYYLITDKLPGFFIIGYGNFDFETNIETIGSFKDLDPEGTSFYNGHYMTDTILYPYPAYEDYNEEEGLKSYTIEFTKVGLETHGAISTCNIYDLLDDEGWPYDIGYILNDMYTYGRYDFEKLSNDGCMTFYFDDNNNCIANVLKNIKVERTVPPGTADFTEFNTFQDPYYPYLYLCDLSSTGYSIKFTEESSLTKIDLEGFSPFNFSCLEPFDLIISKFIEKYGNSPSLLFDTNGQFYLDANEELQFDGLILNCSDNNDSGGSSSEYKMPYITGYLELDYIIDDYNYALLINDINGNQVSNTLVRFTRDSFVSLESYFGPATLEELVENLLNKYLFVAGTENQITFHVNDLE